MSTDGPSRTPTSRAPPIAMPAAPPAVPPAARTPAVTARVAPTRPPERGDTDSDLLMAHVGPSLTLKGDLSGQEDALVEGRVEGRIEIPGHHLTIGPHGVVVGEVVARQVTVLGRMEGDVTVGERIEIAATGRVDGDIRAPTLVVREGAELNGSVTMGQGAISPARRPEPTTRLGPGLMMLETPPPAKRRDDVPEVPGGNGTPAPPSEEGT